MKKIVFRGCSLCEAVCGLAFEVENGRVLSVRPDHEDVFSKGYICPKGVSMLEVHNDPDRLKRPIRRTRGGWKEVSWAEAIEIIADAEIDPRSKSSHVRLQRNSPSFTAIARSYNNKRLAGTQTNRDWNFPEERLVPPVRRDRLLTLAALLFVVAAIIYFTVLSGRKSAAMKGELLEIYQTEGCEGGRSSRLRELLVEYGKVSAGLDDDVEKINEACSGAATMKKGM